MALTQVQGGMLTSGGVTPTQLSTQSQYTGFKNRIINGAMMIDQRNGGTSTTPTTSGDWYAADRWIYNVTQSSKFSSQKSSTAQVGFINSILITSLSAYSVVSSDVFAMTQHIEGLNVSDLGWGTANAQTVTLSFQVRSSLTGTFGGALQNSARDRSYPFSYTISAANTWETKTVTISGDTSGTWLTTNGIGVTVRFGIGMGSTYSGTAGTWAAADYRSATGATSVVGTNGATFYITGVQLEKGSVATSFDYRPYGTEFLLCQRYYQTTLESGSSSVLWIRCGNESGATYFEWIPFNGARMRTSPTVSLANTGYGSGSSGGISQAKPHGVLINFLPSGANGYMTTDYIATAEL